MGQFVVDAVSGVDLPFGCKSPIQGGLYRWAAPTVMYKTLRAGDFGSLNMTYSRRALSVGWAHTVTYRIRPCALGISVREI